MSEIEQETNTGLENDVAEDTSEDTLLTDEGEDGGEDNGEDSSEDTRSLSDGEDNKNSAPETYDFKDLKMPEGIQFDEELAKEFAPIGKELNLTQQQANRLAECLANYQKKQLDSAPEKLAEYKKQESEATKLRYEEMLNKDKEIGGGDKAKMNAYLDTADIGYSNFASPELKGVFKELHLNYHPEVIKLFHKLGTLCGDDSITKATAPIGTKQSAAEILYADSEGN